MGFFHRHDRLATIDRLHRSFRSPKSNHEPRPPDRSHDDRIVRHEGAGTTATASATRLPSGFPLPVPIRHDLRGHEGRDVALIGNNEAAGLTHGSLRVPNDDSSLRRETGNSKCFRMRCPEGHPKVDAFALFLRTQKLGQLFMKSNGGL
jgi:hypothetical protein